MPDTESYDYVMKKQLIHIKKDLMSEDYNSLFEYFLQFIYAHFLQNNNQTLYKCATTIKWILLHIITLKQHSVVY